TTTSLPTMRRLSATRLAIRAGLIASAEERHLGDEADEEDERDRREHQRESHVRLASLLVGHVARSAQAWAAWPPGAGPMILVPAALSRGGVSKVCHGVGDGNSHSRPSAPSHGFCGAGAPLPRSIGSTTANRK